MSDQITWERGNEDYLAAALSWLRLRLEQRGQRGAVKPPLPARLP